MNTININPNLQNKASEIFKTYGLSLDEGVNLLLDKFIHQKLNILDIEIVDKDDPDYQIFKETKNEKTYSLDEVSKELGF